MENASKALIIAGAVLISILLISVGILLMNSSNDMSGTASNLSNGMSNTANHTVTNILQTLE